MVWTIPAPLFASSSDTVDTTFTSDTYVGDLYAYLGSPSVAADYTITADACDVAEIIISASFPAGSTFSFVAINNGRFIGVGGAGGGGALDLGPIGERGGRGDQGGDAIVSYGWPVNIDVDNGFILGGGGGGGGGGFHDQGSFGTPGGGGGGGAGWGNAAGGAAGTPSGLPGVAQPGVAGSQAGPGAGGEGGTTGTIFDNYGGDGGGYGRCGKVGGSPQPSVFLGGFGLSDGTGAAGGDAGAAFFPTNANAVATLNGVKSEATLRAEGRIKGEIGGLILLGAGTNAWDLVTGAGTAIAGLTLKANSLGELQTNNGGNLSTLDFYWYNSPFTITPGDYEMRYLSLSGGGWDTEPGVTDTWYRLDVDRTFEIQATSGIKSALHAVEIGRYNENEACATGFLFAYAEFEP